MEYRQAPVSHEDVAGQRSPADNNPFSPATTGDISVVIALSSEVNQHGIACMVRSMTAVSAVRATASARGAVTEMSRNQTGLVITSTDTPPDHYALLRSRAQATGARTLLILPSTGHLHIQRAASYEAEGYLLEQDLTVLVLENAVRRIAASDTILPHRLARTMLTHIQSSNWAGGRRPVLTQREQQILQLLVEGLSNKQITSRLNISQHCTKRHVANLISKLECTNRTQAAALALREGLLG